MLFAMATLLFACEETNTDDDPNTEEVTPESDDNNEGEGDTTIYVVDISTSGIETEFTLSSVADFSYDLSVYAYVLPEDATELGITYSISEDDTDGVASITEAGVLTFSDFGAAVVTLTAQDSDAYSEDITITVAAERFEVIDPLHAISIGTATTLKTTTEGTYTWTSSDTSIATVDAASGTVTGVASGTATITATSEAGIAESQDVTVAPEGILCVDFSEAISVDAFTTLGFTYQSSSYGATAALSEDGDCMILTPSSEAIYIRNSTQSLSDDYKYFAFKAELDPVEGTNDDDASIYHHFSTARTINDGTNEYATSVYGDYYGKTGSNAPSTYTQYYAAGFGPQVFNYDYTGEMDDEDCVTFGYSEEVGYSNHTLTYFDLKFYNVVSRHDGYIKIYWMYHFKDRAAFLEFMEAYEEPTTL